MANNHDARRNFFGRIQIIFLLSVGCGLGAVLLTNYLNGGSITSLAAASPGQALLYSALFTVFVWVFNLAFNIGVLWDRSSEVRLLRQEIRDLREAVERLGNRGNVNQGEGNNP